MRFSGLVITGRGEGAGFTCLDWVRDRLLNEIGIDPHPGTLNLLVENQHERDGWVTLKETRGSRIDPPSSQWCSARCYAIRLDGRFPAGVVLPEVPDYPPWQVEVVAALPIRETLSIADGDRVIVEACRPLPVQAVIFDVDGTLVDSLAAYRIVAERAAEPHGFAITEAHVREALSTTRPFWDLVVPSDRADRAATMEALSHAASRMWPDVLREHARVFPGVHGLLRTLRGCGVKLGIVTGSSRGALAALGDASLLDLFESIVSGDDVQRRKPDPEGLLTCADALRVASADAVYVGDSPLDIQAGRAAGMRTIGLLTGAGDSAALSACGPDRLVRSHERLIEVLMS